MLNNTASWSVKGRDKVCGVECRLKASCAEGYGINTGWWNKVRRAERRGVEQSGEEWSRVERSWGDEWRQGGKLREGDWFVAAKMPQRVPTFRCTEVTKIVDACLCESAHVPTHLKKRPSSCTNYSINVLVRVLSDEAKRLILYCLAYGEDRASGTMINTLAPMKKSKTHVTRRLLTLGTSFNRRARRTWWNGGERLLGIHRWASSYYCGLRCHFEWSGRRGTRSLSGATNFTRVAHNEQQPALSERHLLNGTSRSARGHPGDRHRKDVDGADAGAN